MRAIVGKFLTDRSGATAVEYSILLAVLSLAIVSGVELTGNAMDEVWLKIANTINDSWK